MAREAAIRNRLLWGGGALAVVAVLLVLARAVTMWVVLVPLGILCLTAMALGLALGLANRGLPYLPRTRRVHSLLLVVIAPLVLAIVVQVGPKTTKEQREFDEAARRAAEAQAEEERQSSAKLDCQVYIYQRLNVPSSADFSHSARLFSREGGGYLVRGWVEAQNAFGAKLRRQYECAVDGSGQVVSGKVFE